MNSIHHRQPPAPDEAMNDLPSLDGLIAGTTALMTTWADPAPGDALDQACRRSLVARKVVSNLFFLMHHPQLDPRLRQVMANAHQRWRALVQRAASDTPAAAAGTGGPDLDAQAPGPRAAWLH